MAGTGTSTKLQRRRDKGDGHQRTGRSVPEDLSRRYTEEQIIRIPKLGKAGVKPTDLYREHGISAAMLYGWKEKFGRMDVTEAQRLKDLEGDNCRLKLLMAELNLHGMFCQ